jgi:hypothetical protein
VLQVSGDQLRYKLTPLEALGACGPSPSVSLNDLVSVNKEENPWNSSVLRGIRAPGTGFPFLIMLGTMRHKRGKDFCVVYKKNPVLVLEFEKGPWARWVIPASAANEELLAKLQVLS